MTHEITSLLLDTIMLHRSMACHTMTRCPRVRLGLRYVKAAPDCANNKLYSTLTANVGVSDDAACLVSAVREAETELPSQD